MKKVLVTGATGYVGLHCVVDLIKNGFFVRGSVRTPSREAEIRKVLIKELGSDQQFECCELNLSDDKGWDEACSGCEFVLHVASPLPFKEPKDENELIGPAKEGALRVLKAAKKAGVARVVLTSSVAAIAYGHQNDEAYLYTEADWTDIEGPDVTAYVKSKTLAEKAAWEFINNQESNATHKLELSVINPGLIIGPMLGDDIGATSIQSIVKLLKKELPFLPNICFYCVDVRDVAMLHRGAMLSDQASGKRFLAVGNKEFSFIDFGQMLNEAGFDVPTKRAPDFLIHFLGLFQAEMKTISRFLNKNRQLDPQKTFASLNWTPINTKESLIDMAKSIQAVLDKEKMSLKKIKL